MTDQWYELEVSPAALKDAEITEIYVAEKTISILKKGTNIYAFAATCPHAGGRLCEGWIDALGRVVCPLHSYRFDPLNGRNTSGEGYKLKTYPVEIRNDRIFVRL